MRGRGALALGALLALLAAPAPAAAAFSLQGGAAGFDASILEQGGASATAAGSHPFALSLHAGFGGGDVREVSFELPAGLIENPRALPPCSRARFASGCPAASQVGLLSLRTAGAEHAFALFNLEPAPGRPYQLGARPFGAPLTFAPTLRQGGGEYGITLIATNVTQVVAIEALDLEIWGTPWAAAHDGRRGACLNEADPGSPLGQCPIDTEAEGRLARAYLTMPTDCSRPLRFSVAASGWGSAEPATAGVQRQTPTGCESLPFSFGALATPGTALASSPSGLALRLTTSQAGLTAPAQRISSAPRRAIAVLAEGITINPALGAGLGACTQARFAAESAASAPGEGCPNPSKIGVGSVQTPLLEGALEGSIHIATPFENPFGSPYALYFVARSPERGVLVKAAGRLDPDPASGRLTATFTDLPQLPYTSLSLDFREGQRAPLASPPTCGTHSNRIELRPWSDPGAVKAQTSAFAILRGPGAGPCPSGAAPFAPRAIAGALNSDSGSATAFYAHLTRTDPEQEITSYSLELPRGVTGAIAGIPQCPDAAIAAAASRPGQAEAADPSCPAQSQVGRTFVGYGVGLAPAYAPGRIYLAGPYRGSALSLVAIDPAVVGPFDLGTIVIRSALRIDPRTAQLSIDSSVSDPIPHIFAGVPLRLRDIRVHIDRPGFAINPTSCEASQVLSTLTGSGERFSDPADDTTATVANHFQLSNCSAREFAPRLFLRLRGKTRRGAYPALRAVFEPRAGDANARQVQVTLPQSAFLAQNHIRSVCTRERFGAESCPPDSIYGRAVAQTPLLDEPLAGPLYLRSSENPLPDLVLDLRAGAIRIVLVGRVDSVGEGRIRASFDDLPDARLTRFVLNMRGGKRGLIVNSASLCATKARAKARMIAQNNKALASAPRLQAKCPKKAKGRGKGRQDRAGSGAKRGGR